MKLSEVTFAQNEEGNFWEKLSRESGVFILPLHAEKWYLLKKQGDWDEIFREVDIFVADGVGLSLGFRFLTGKTVQKISGIDLIEDLVKNHPEIPTFIWGTTKENIKKAAQSYKKRGLNLVGFHDGFSGENDDVLKKIKESEAKIVFVGMGAKRAAELCVRIKKELGVSAMTAGGTFDVAGGKFKRAPVFFQKTGLEWLWRMLADLRRFRRLPALLGFVWYVILEKMKPKLKKINPFDFMVLVLGVLFLVLFALVFIRPPKDFGDPVVMSVQIYQNPQIVAPKVREGETVFVNGVNVESQILEVSANQDVLNVEIEGLGKKEDGLFTFNGQRVLVGQEAELRGNFWAQGIITDLRIK